MAITTATFLSILRSFSKTLASDSGFALGLFFIRSTASSTFFRDILKCFIIKVSQLMLMIHLIIDYLLCNCI